MSLPPFGPRERQVGLAPHADSDLRAGADLDVDPRAEALIGHRAHEQVIDRGHDPHRVTGAKPRVELYYILPLMMFLVPAVYLVRAKLFSKIRGNDLESFEEELGATRSIWNQLKELFR